MAPLTNGPFSHDPSATAAFAALPDLVVGDKTLKRMRAVVIGGGTGAPVSIRTLLSMGIQTSAVVSMADDGGSTGILRDQVGATPPGDVRKCITAMAADADDPMTKAFKTRFSFAENHTLGNLMLTTLESTAGGFPEAIAICEQLLKARGKVYPSTLDRVTLVAKTRDGRTIEGQAVACHSRAPLSKVVLRSESGISAYEPAVEAIRAADLIVLGPGSLFTSIISSLLVPGIEDAVRASGATVVFACSLADIQGETRGLSALDHYRALEAHGMHGLVDVMLMQSAQSADERPWVADGTARPLAVNEGDIEAIEKQGTRVLVRDLVDESYPTWHDPAKLRSALLEVIRTRVV